MMSLISRLSSRSCPCVFSRFINVGLIQVIFVSLVVPNALWDVCASKTIVDREPRLAWRISKLWINDVVDWSAIDIRNIFLVTNSMATQI